MNIKNIEDMKPGAIKKLLKKIVEKLDALDSDDFFGTEGWKHHLLGED